MEHADPEPDFRWLTTTLYAGLSNVASDVELWKLAELFHPDARLIRLNDDQLPLRDHATRGSRPAADTTRIMTFDEFVENVAPRIVARPFEESELSHESAIVGDIAHVISGYRSSMDRGGANEIVWHGHNFFHLVRQSGTWRILNVVWDAAPPSGSRTG